MVDASAGKRAKNSTRARSLSLTVSLAVADVLFYFWARQHAVDRLDYVGPWNSVSQLLVYLVAERTALVVAFEVVQEDLGRSQTIILGLPRIV